MDTIKRQERVRRSAIGLRHQFAQGGNGMFSNVLRAEEVANLLATEAGNYRDRLYPPLTTLRLFIGQVLSAKNQRGQGQLTQRGQGQLTGRCRV